MGNVLSLAFKHFADPGHQLLAKGKLGNPEAHLAHKMVMMVTTQLIRNSSL